MDKLELLQFLNTKRSVFGPVNPKQVNDLCLRAEKARLLSFIDPNCIVKVNRRIEGLRVVSNSQLTQMLNSEIFTDPLLRKYQIRKIDDLRIDIIPNNFCCLPYPELHQTMGDQLIKNRPVPEARKYRDLRLIAGVKAPDREFKKYDMMEEKKRIEMKEGHIMGCIEDHTTYLINPSAFDHYLTNRPDFRCSQAAKYFHPNLNLVIYIGNGEFRIVHTKLEQWIWEQYVKTYAETAVKRLNSLIYDDNPKYEVCRIFVPPTQSHKELYSFINRFKSAFVTPDPYNMYGVSNFF